MSRQDKTTSERHTKTLRDLVKKPENKVCADCKRNDPRWASWNLGVFLCIRCSGIHRGMGTHISKIKSVDLDIWNQEQMDSIQRWGNARANLYWEAHLKPGHIPAEHKMESFIRSKYESRRWALEGPPPRDPSVLESGREPPAPPSPPPRQTTSTRATAPAQRHSRTLLSSQTQSKPRDTAQTQSRPTSAATPIVTGAAPNPQDDLFSLDFHAPVSSAAPASAGLQKKDVKNDILSLFTSSPPGTGVMAGGDFNAAQAQVIAQPGMTSTAATGAWSAQPGRNAAQAGPPTQWGQQFHAGQHSLWGEQQQQQPFGTFSGPAQPAQNTGLFATQSVWGGGGVVHSTTSAGPDLLSSSFATTAAPQPAKKDDAFGDLWNGFK